MFYGTNTYDVFYIYDSKVVVSVGLFL